MSENTSLGLKYVREHLQNALNNWAPKPRMRTVWITWLYEISDRLGLEPRLELPPPKRDRTESPFIALPTFLAREISYILNHHTLVVENEYDHLVQEYHDLCALKYDTAMHMSVTRMGTIGKRLAPSATGGPVSHNENACLNELAESFEQEFPQLAQAIGIRDLVNDIPLRSYDEGPYDKECYTPPCLVVFEALLQPAIEADSNAGIAWKLFREQQLAQCGYGGV